MDKFDKYFISKSINYKDKLCVVTGATGSLGFYISHFLLLSGAKLILVGRSKSKLEKTLSELKSTFPNSEISYLICDFSLIDDTIKLYEDLKSLNIDYLFNNAGCYHLPVKMIEDHDVTFITNFISPIFLTKKLSEQNKRLVVVQTASISYKFTKLNLKDLEQLKTKNKTKRYGSSKRLLMLSTLELQKSLQNSIILSHPGISTTSLFNSSKGGFGKLFNAIAVPIMKIIFMKPKKAALSMALAPSFNYQKETIIGPRGLFSARGYPTIKNFKYKNFKSFEINNISEIIKNSINF